MKSTKLRQGAAFAAALTFASTSTAFAEDNKVLDRLDRLEHRIDSLESDVKDRDAKIQTLEDRVKDRDAKIQNLQNGQSAAAASAAQIQPAAGQPTVGQPADAQRLDNLERTVKQLNEVTNAQAEEMAKPKGPKVTTKGGLKVESEDGQFSFQPIGRLHYDAAFYDQDKSKMGDGSQLRRARLGMTGKMFGDWMYKLEVDFARNTGSGTVGVKDAYISYLGWDLAQITVGNFKEPFSINNLTSTNYLSFIERPLPITQPTSSLMPDRHMGIAASHYDSNWSASVGTFMAHTDVTVPPNEGDQSFDVAARVTYDPILEKGRLVHLGLSGLYRNPSDSPVAFDLKPESNVTGAQFLKTDGTPTALNPGALTAVDHLYDVDPELALTYGPVSFLGEYFWVPITQHQHDSCPNPGGAAAANLRRCPNVTLTGWYTELSYFLTGESRPYSAATARFDRLMPNHNLGKDGWGAFEVAARISHADFDDGPDFQKGTETNYTLGLNWYANPYIRFMMDYVWVRNNASAAGNVANLLPGNASAGYDDPSILEFRAQVDW